MIVATSATTVTEIHGIGPLTAAIIIGRVGDISRFPTVGHFARHNGTAPIEASSGPKKRHRLNPRGDRQLNHAIHMAAVTQVGHDTPGRVYYLRKQAEGKTRKEAMRALKRHISDAVYQRLVADTRRLTLDRDSTLDRHDRRPVGSGGQREDVTESSVAGIAPHMTRLFGTVTPEPDNTLTRTTTTSARPTRPHHTPKTPLDTKRIRSALVLSTEQIGRSGASHPGDHLLDSERDPKLGGRADRPTPRRQFRTRVQTPKSRPRSRSVGVPSRRCPDLPRRGTTLRARSQPHANDEQHDCYRNRHTFQNGEAHPRPFVDRCGRAWNGFIAGHTMIVNWMCGRRQP